MHPQLYQRAKETITNMTRADYLYLISYANYSGYRIEHDPLYTVYFAPTTAGATGSSLGGLLVIAALAGLVIVVTVGILKRKNSKKSPKPPIEQPLPPPPSI